MFDKGEAVVYPLHGAGIIENLEEKCIDGETRNYYVLNLPLGNLTILLCCESAENTKLRKVMPKNDIEVIVKTSAKVPKPAKAESWAVRYKENMDKIRSGMLREVADVFFQLHYKEKDKGLSGAEKKMLTMAKKIVMSEIMLAYNIDKIEAEEILERYAI
ncbi:MAG: CarD family transcriptional regulator [Clostridiales bacterium]|jgi:CarD family transcriptional regulator|nr:CarD family transcriptional regulator [Clostridiales bacterium]